jgi:hypothetical protein
MKVAPYPLVESLPSRPPMTFGTLPYFAALTGLPDYVPCFVLAQPEHDLIRDLQGPIDPICFRQLLGFTTKEGHS